MRQTTARIRCDSLRDVEPSDHVLWQKVKIREIGKVVTGMTPPTKHQAYYGDDYLFVTPSDLDFDSYIVSKTERCISKQGYEKYSNRFIPAMSTMYTCIGSTIGKIGLCRDTVLTNQQINSIIPNDVHDAKFVYYLMRSQTNEIRALNAGCAVPIINKGDFENIDVHLPPLPVQRRIADVLSAYDDLIENNRRRIAILEETARRIFEAEIVNGNWECEPVDALVEVNPEVSKPTCDGIRYIPMSALSTSGMTVDLSDSEVRAQSTSVRFVNGDVLLARITPCLENGKTAYVNFLAEGEIGCGSSEFIVLRGRRVSSFFTYCLARLEAFRGIAIKSMIGASGRQRVQLSCFTDFQIQVPDDATLRRFDAAVEPMFDQIGVLSRQSASLAAARDMLLPRLMNNSFRKEV